MNKTVSSEIFDISSIAANREVDGFIRDGVRVEFKDARGRNRKERFKIIDFSNPKANRFLAVTQLWIQGERRYRRPDILLDDSYDKDLFVEKRDKVFELTLDLAINHRKWAA